MCGRFTATFEFSDIRVRWNLDRDLPKYTPRFNIAPEQTSPTIPVIVRHQGGNECRLMHWGLIPHWAADPSIGNRMINARAETLTELPSFKSLVNRGRCIIPADGYYEWRKERKRKVPMWVHLKTSQTYLKFRGRFSASDSQGSCGCCWSPCPSRQTQRHRFGRLPPSRWRNSCRSL